MPERREEVTTEGGLDVAGQRDRVAEVDRAGSSDAGISVSLFLDPDPRQIEAAAELGADAVELHTGQYALARPGAEQQEQLETLADAGSLVRRAGHGAARRPRADLSQRAAGRRHRGHARTEHRPQHRRPGDHGRLRAGRARDEATDRRESRSSARLTARGTNL